MYISVELYVNVLTGVLTDFYKFAGIFQGCPLVVHFYRCAPLDYGVFALFMFSGDYVVTYRLVLYNLVSQEF